MKRASLMIVLLLMVALILPVSAQVRVGIIGGINFSDMEGTGEREVSGKTVFGVGGMLDLGLWKDFSLCLEPMYIQKYAIAEEIDIENPAIDVKLAFLECPVFLKYSFGNTIRPYFIAGPAIGYLLSSEMEINLGGITFEANTKEITEKLDIGLGFGGGISISTGPCSVFLEGRYTLGLNNLNKGGVVIASAGPLHIEGDIPESDKMKNRGVQLMAGISLSLSGR